MRIIAVRNVHAALPAALQLLDEYGFERDSRNGKVRTVPGPVATWYTDPLERVMFWPERDANPFFHLFEALHYLAGRNDVAPLVGYSKQIASYSDDGVTLHGAYGYRWRRHFPSRDGLDIDQLAVIARRLQKNPEDRRCVLQMWDTPVDLDSPSKDVPCNTIATLQRDENSALNLTVFQRSGDILWGVYGANAVHMSFLLEYLALWIGCPVGTYCQITVNWHAYLAQGDSEPLAQVAGVPRAPSPNPYLKVTALPLLKNGAGGDAAIARVDTYIQRLFTEVAAGFNRMYTPTGEPFFDMAYHVLYAHHCFKTLAAPERYDRALDALARGNQTVDWVVAAREWILRRRAAWERKMLNA